MRLIFIYGLPATGKLTVAKELEQITGYKLFHNHLVVDLLLSTFAFGSEPFVELREQIWLSFFEQASRSRVPGLIFTFNPETSVRPSFVPRTVETITGDGGTVDFVELVTPLNELKQRIDSPSRLEYRKLSSLALFEQLEARGEFDTSHMPKARVTVDTGQFPAAEAATQIATALGLT